MWSWPPRRIVRKPTILGSVKPRQRASFPRPTAVMTTASSRSSPTAWWHRSESAGQRRSSSLAATSIAFDSTTIDLCLSVFEWALFRKRKGGIKVHTLYDIETQVPTFFHITPARVHDMKAMDTIPYEENSFYIFDRGYNDFKRLHNIESIGAYFVVRGKKNNDFKPERWKRRFPKDSGILSDAIGHMDGTLTGKKYPDRIRRVVYWDVESKRRFVFFINALDIKPVTVADLYKTAGR